MADRIYPIETDAGGEMEAKKDLDDNGVVSETPYKSSNNDNNKISEGAIVGGIDAESGEAVKRDLKPRHLSLIAIGGAIGTGLFVGSGGALSRGGPAGMLLGYSIVGSLVYAMVVALAEMTTLFPIAGGFAHYAARFVDPSLGFALGWNYWYCYAIALPTDLTAATIVIQYWDQSTNVAVYITVMTAVVIFINLFNVRVYGEAEFVMVFIKLTAIIGLIILGIVISCGGGPNHESIGFRFWNDPGPFVQYGGIPGAKGRFLAFFGTFTQAAFSFLGTEIVALTAAEAPNPRKTMPKAIKLVFYRIVTFYVFGVLVITMTVPSNNQDLLGGTGNATSSPWVIAIELAGIKVLPSIINAVILLSAFSAGNSVSYAASRILWGLAINGQAPAIFKRTVRWGVPLYAVAGCAVIAPLAYLNCSNKGATVFNWLFNISHVQKSTYISHIPLMFCLLFERALTGCITWAVILLSYLRFHYGLRHKGIDRKTLPYRAPLQPYLSYYGLVGILIILLFCGFGSFMPSFSYESFLVYYLADFVMIALYIGHKVIRRPSFVRLENMDFDTGRTQLEAAMLIESEKHDHGPPKSIWAKAMSAII